MTFKTRLKNYCTNNGTGLLVISRCKWNEKRERSTRCFYRIIQSHNKFEDIEELDDENGVDIQERADKHNEITKFYSKLFKTGNTNSDSQVELLNNIKSELDSQDNQNI
ncbi:hypothetical protein AYI69_g9134 [Smittium culicis]|uniref:Uncharacterized protein n=1 Tax=Smittium culicis TaxID=133412 RepID=A0A1R1XER3_9FUNG|nr:hypothetical protein AYI69_g9134 [Smittium culicis]